MSFEIGGVLWTPITDESIEVKPIITSLNDAALVSKVLKATGLCDYLTFGHCHKCNSGLEVTLSAISLGAITRGNVEDEALYEVGGFLVETYVIEEARLFMSSVFDK